jgi:hypothetical protein
LFSDESEVSLDNEENGSDFAPWKASQSPEPEDDCPDAGKNSGNAENKAELLKSTLTANIGEFWKTSSL